MTQRSFISHPRQALQHRLKTFPAPESEGISPIASKSRRSLPMTRRLHAEGPTSRTIAETSTGTRHATGVIGTEAPIRCTLASQDKSAVRFGAVAGNTPGKNAATARNFGQGKYIHAVFNYPLALNYERPAVKRGYVGAAPTDCIRHDDYRSADFIGPLVPA